MSSVPRPSFPKIVGLVAAPYTPFTAGGDVNPGKIDSQCGLLMRNNVRVVFVCGTTGEGSALTREERKAVAAEWVRVGRSNVRVIVHVGHAALRESCELAAHAQNIGADAIATVAPGRPGGLPELVAWCREVAAQAPSLPFYYYHMPEVTGVSIPACDFLQRAAEEIPTLAGIKFTHEDLMDFQHCRAFEAGRYDILFGRDQFLLSALALGASGAVGSTYNFAAPLYQRMMGDYTQGRQEQARNGQSQAAQMVSQLRKSGGLSAGKAVMELVGVDCGPTRLPLRTLGRGEKLALFRSLEAIGFAAFCCK